MNTIIAADKAALGKAAAAAARTAIEEALAAFGQANIILATGASQFHTLDNLVQAPLDWSAVTVFHLDEYIGLPASHPASFRRYLRERLIDRVGSVRTFVEIEGDAADPDAELARLNRLIGDVRIDVCFAGIGENCHLAFNDPPADFEVQEPYIIVTLDEDCRRQQTGEGWFETIADVPQRAISMSIQQILKSRQIILSVPDERKAAAVRAAVRGEVTNLAPASILQRHPNVQLYLDPHSARLLE